MSIEDEDFEGGEMSVPPHLLELHIQEEDDTMTQERYEEVFSAQADPESGVGGQVT